MDSEKDHNFLLQWALVDCLVAERADSLLGSPGLKKVVNFVEETIASDDLALGF